MVDLLGTSRREGSVVICGAVYAELLAHPKVNTSFVDSFLLKTSIAVDFEIGEPVWREAALCYAQYAERRRISGMQEPKRLLVDFLVGAHASLTADRLLSLDASRYAIAFPELQILPSQL